MRWLFRLFLRLFVFPLIALFILFLLAFHFYPQEKLRAIAADQIGHRIHRQIELGRIHLGLRGLVIDDLRLSNTPTFQAGTLLTAKGVRLGWDLPALWEGLSLRQKFITRSKGSFHVDEFHNPHYSAHDFELTWSLSGMDSTWTHLSGWARLSQGPGLLENINQLIETSPSAKLALMPITTLTNLERSGFVNLGLPDLRHWPIQEIEGDYEFDKGFMHIDRFTITSAQLGMETTGVVELASQKLSLDVELKSPKNTALGALDIKTHVTGTVSQPHADLELLRKKAFQATLSNFLQNPNAASDALKKIFRQ
jgi:hypothetical protein